MKKFCLSIIFTILGVGKLTRRDLAARANRKKVIADFNAVFVIKSWSVTSLAEKSHAPIDESRSIVSLRTMPRVSVEKRARCELALTSCCVQNVRCVPCVRCVWCGAYGAYCACGAVRAVRAVCACRAVRGVREVRAVPRDAVCYHAAVGSDALRLGVEVPEPRARLVECRAMTKAARWRRGVARALESGAW